MKTVALYEAKNRLSELIDQVQGGEVVAITRHGKLCAQLVGPPADVAAPPPSVAAAFARLATVRERLDLDGNLKLIAREGLD
jgi:prevent-host-death family protein